MNLKLGKLPARKDSITLKFGTYSKNVPQPPKSAGHKDLITAPWQMLANDKYGDCVWAGAAHETMLWNKEADVVVPFSDGAVLSDYSAVTGFNPKDPSTDQGTDMQVAASYRRKTGIRDAKGRRHKIDAYLAIKSAFEIRQGIWLFNAVGLGVKFPTSAMKQFKAGKPFTVVRSGIEGGHYMPVIGYDKKYVYLVTWGKVVAATWEWVNKYRDESIAYLSLEMLQNGKSLEGFDLSTLRADIAAL
jgi:hypothetical protein